MPLQPVSPYLLLTLTVLFWSGNFVLGRAVGGTVPPIALSFLRWLFAGLILLPFVAPRLRPSWPQLRASWGILTLLGVLGVTNFNTFVYLGLQNTTATNALLMVATTPVLIVLLARLLFGTPVSFIQVIGIAVSLSGAALIISGGHPIALLTGLALGRGELWVLAAVLSWALYSLLLRYRPAGLDPLVMLFATIVIGILPLLPLELWELGQGLRPRADTVTVLSVAYVAVFPSVLAYVFWNHGVAQVGPARAGQFLHLMPLLGTLLAVILLGERLSGYHLLGMTLIFGGIVLATRGAN